jgi:alginate O-acetyltransferase complex protein AlgI
VVFSSTLFLLCFLPIALGVHALLPQRWRNAWLLAVSLLFYAWGEVFYTALMLISIAWNHACGRWIARERGTPRQRIALAVAVGVNLGLLAACKYGNFALANLGALVPAVDAARRHYHPIHLPIGISFFTFQAISYVVDVARGEAEAQRNPLRTGLYIALFPQLIAGPIVRYGAIAAQLAERIVTRDGVAAGLRRFIIGLAKKVLIANTLAVPADALFAADAGALSAGAAWLALASYTAQIYFDFSGYSDMAIGLGRCFGFTFPENFSYPYAATSIRDFWRRWHISLSTWFRDYLYIPLGGNRGSTARTAGNLLAVFLLCGLWHGAAWTFVLWGLWHGAFLALERTALSRGLAALPAPAGRLYTLGIVMTGWVWFRAESFGQAGAFFGALAGTGAGTVSAAPHFGAHIALALFAAMAGSVPWWPAWRDAWAPHRREGARAWAFELTVSVVLLGLFVGSISAVVAGTHNPFIYYRF